MSQSDSLLSGVVRVPTADRQARLGELRRRRGAELPYFALRPLFRFGTSNRRERLVNGVITWQAPHLVYSSGGKAHHSFKVMAELIPTKTQTQWCYEDGRSGVGPTPRDAYAHHEHDCRLETYNLNIEVVRRAKLEGRIADLERQLAEAKAAATPPVTPPPSPISENNVRLISFMPGAVTNGPAETSISALVSQGWTVVSMTGDSRLVTVLLTKTPAATPAPLRTRAHAAQSMRPQPVLRPEPNAGASVMVIDMGSPTRSFNEAIRDWSLTPEEVRETGQQEAADAYREAYEQAHAANEARYTAVLEPLNTWRKRHVPTAE